MPSCYDVFMYWRNLNITETGDVSETEGVPVVTVDCEYAPRCWACGAMVDKKDMFSWDNYDLSLREVWSDKRVNSRLQKAHIFARQFGGEDTVDNLFLLCENCHAESPDTRNRSAFFRWVYRKKKEACYGFHWKKMLSDGEAEIRARGYDPVRFLRSFDKEEISDIVVDGLHRCGTHGVHFAESSIVVSIIDEMERRIMARRSSEVESDFAEMMREYAEYRGELLIQENERLKGDPVPEEVRQKALELIERSFDE